VVASSRSGLRCCGRAVFGCRAAGLEDSSGEPCHVHPAARAEAGRARACWKKELAQTPEEQQDPATFTDLVGKGGGLCLKKHMHRLAAQKLLSISDAQTVIALQVGSLAAFIIYECPVSWASRGLLPLVFLWCFKEVPTLLLSSRR